MIPTQEEITLQREEYRYGDKRQYRNNPSITAFDTLIYNIRQSVAEKGYTLSRWQTNEGGYCVTITYAIHFGDRPYRSDLLPDDCLSCCFTTREGTGSKGTAYREVSRLFTKWKRERGVMLHDFPYQEYMDTTAWKVIASALADLVENQDVVLTTHQDYVIGYLVKALAEKCEGERRQGR